METTKKGKLFVITGPSGVGKGTILEKFFHNNNNIIYSISQTTRKPRPGEVHGVNYFFVTKEEFENSIKKIDHLSVREESLKEYIKRFSILSRDKIKNLTYNKKYANIKLAIAM